MAETLTPYDLPDETKQQRLALAEQSDFMIFGETRKSHTRRVKNGWNK